MEEIDPQTSKTGNLEASRDRRDCKFVNTDVKKDLSEASLIVESPAESPKVAAVSTENNLDENRGSNKKKKNKLTEKAKGEDETQNMGQTNINTGSTETITEGNMNGKRKRGSRIKEEIKIMNQVDSLSKFHLSDSNHGEGNVGRVSENEYLAKDFEISVRKESSLSVSVHNKDKPLELCKDEEVEISGRKESSLAGLMHMENHLSMCKEEETVTLPVMAEGSGNQVSLEIVGERSEHSLRPIEVGRKFIPCEGKHSSFPYQVTGENVMIENGLNQLRDEAVINEGQCSAEEGSIFSVCNVEGTSHLSSSSVKEAVINDLEYYPGIMPIPSITRKLIVLDVNGLLANIVMPAPKDYRGDTHILGRASKFSCCHLT